MRLIKYYTTDPLSLGAMALSPYNTEKSDVTGEIENDLNRIRLYVDPSRSDVHDVEIDRVHRDNLDATLTEKVDDPKSPKV